MRKLRTVVSFRVQKEIIGLPIKYAVAEVESASVDAELGQQESTTPEFDSYFVESSHDVCNLELGSFSRRSH